MVAQGRFPTHNVSSPTPLSRFSRVFSSRSASSDPMACSSDVSSKKKPEKLNKNENKERLSSGALGSMAGEELRVSTDSYKCGGVDAMQGTRSTYSCQERVWRYV